MQKLTLLMLLSATMFSLVACTSNEEHAKKLNTNNLTLKAGQSSKLIYDGSCTWRSQEPLIAEVDNNGNVYAKLVGATLVWANDESCNVTVTPNFNTYIEPCTEWGVSMAYIEDIMKDFESHGQVENTLSFEDIQREIAYIYSFESNMLQQSIIIAKLSKADEITDFLLERYLAVEVDMDNYIAAFISIDKKNAVFLMFVDGLTTVVYIPCDSSFQSMGINTKTITSKSVANMNKENITEVISLLRKIEENISF